METLNYNKKCWEQPCPKVDCRKDTCKCGLKRVVIPALLGDDSEGSKAAPKNGAYCNAIVTYEANGHTYIYSKEGIPTLIDVDAAGIDELDNRVKEVERDVKNIEEDIDNIDSNIEGMSNDISQAKGDITDIQGDITDIEAEIKSLDDDFIFNFDTVADMKASTRLVNGSYARTGGFHSANDGGGALYKIGNVGPANEMDVIAVGNLYATIILPSTVSPEMFGAYGDGTHDDTNAWNRAVSVGKNVKSFEKNYLVSTIEVTNDIDIDCGNASFISSATRLFRIHGEVVDSLTGESNYTADDIDYVISNAQYSTYTGFAFVRGDNNFQPSRTYYRGGFACTFDHGKISASYPIPVTNTVIDIVNPVSGSLRNIKNISHQTVTNANRSIHIEYAEGYIVENISGKGLQAYVDIDIVKSINVTCKNLDITHDVTFSDNVSYIVMIEDSSFCNLTESYLYSRKWHSWTTSGIYLCFRNSVTDSTLLSDTGIAICDHENALGTTLDNLSCTCAVVAGMSYVNNINVFPVKDNQRRCNIALMAPAIEKNGAFTVTNIYLNLDSNANGTYCGIWLSQNPQESGGTYYYRNIYVENVKTNKTVISRVYYNLADASTFIIGKVTVKNCCLDVNLPKTAKTNIDVSNSEFYIDGIDEFALTKYADIGASDAHANKVTINNSHLRQIAGSITTLVINNLLLTDTSQNLSVTNLYGSNLQSRIHYNVIKAATIVNISNMQYNASAQHFNFVKAGGTVYYQEVNTSTGLFETKTIA